MRCFAALELPAPVRRHLARTIEPLRRFPLRWVPEDQLHLTLWFAGDFDPSHRDELLAMVRDLELPPIELQLAGLSHFPPKGMPRVAHAAIGGDVEPVADLADQLTAIGERLDVPRERRPFVAHVTLGRLKSPFGALALLDQLETVGAALNPKPFAVPALVVYESRLLPTGPLHRPLLQRSLPQPAGGDVTPRPD